MKITTLLCAITAVSIGMSAPAFAQGNDRRGPSEELPRSQQQGPRQSPQYEQPRYSHGGDQRWDRRPDYRGEHRGYGREDFRDGRHNDRRDFYYNARGPEFYRGGYIPHEFRSRPYVVNDYRQYRLVAPPRGHQWVQVGPDYVLVAIATGLIASIVLGR